MLRVVVVACVAVGIIDAAFGTKQGFLQNLDGLDDAVQVLALEQENAALQSRLQQLEARLGVNTEPEARNTSSESGHQPCVPGTDEPQEPRFVDMSWGLGEEEKVTRRPFHA
jgi:hypothetical protein